MRKFVKWTVRVVALLAVVGIAAGIWKREELARLMAVNTLFDADRIVHNFSNMDGAFLHAELARGDAPASPLPAGTPMTMPESYEAWVNARTVTSALVLRNGEIVHEAYYLSLIHI